MDAVRGARSVLLVCTGNVCRSPAAELLLRDRLGPDSTLLVRSGGLEALVGEPIAAPMARLLARHGLHDPGRRARQLRPDLVRDADLVLTMTTEQRSTVVRWVPAAVRRTYTLAEFAGVARLVQDTVPADDGPDRLAAVLRTLSRARPQRIPDDDIEDPYRKGDEVFARVLDRITADVDTVATLLRPRRVATAPE